MRLAKAHLSSSSFLLVVVLAQGFTANGQITLLPRYAFATAQVTLEDDGRRRGRGRTIKIRFAQRIHHDFVPHDFVLLAPVNSSKVLRLRDWSRVVPIGEFRRR